MLKSLDKTNIQKTFKKVVHAFDTVQARLKQHQRYSPVVSFALGFLVDVFTLGRIDQWDVLAQQLFFLVLAGGFLSWEFLVAKGYMFAPSSKPMIFLNQHKSKILHFSLGALLSAFALFYFKSASLSSSLAFMGILVALMIGNEFNRFKDYGERFRWALYAFCWISYLLILVPLFLGEVGLWAFVIAVVISGLSVFLIRWFILKKNFFDFNFDHYFTWPSTVVLALFVVLYSLKWIPPVPLSLHHIGIYHELKKSNGDYTLAHYRPWWRFWHHSDEWFDRVEGDEIVVFFKLFAPRNFKDLVQVKWFHKNSQGDWIMVDKIPIAIIGGREEGYRGFAKKRNFESGDWVVKVVTRDNLEIGRQSFSVENVEQHDRPKRIIVF